MARRRRNEWESRIKAAKAEKEQPFNRPPERALSITEDHFDSPGPNETSPPSTSGASANTSGKQKMVKSKVNKGKGARIEDTYLVQISLDNPLVNWHEACHLSTFSN